jgi:hypothetical protein
VTPGSQGQNRRRRGADIEPEEILLNAAVLRAAINVPQRVRLKVCMASGKIGLVA